MERRLAEILRHDNELGFPLPVFVCGGGSWGRHAGRKDVRSSAGKFKAWDVVDRGEERRDPFHNVYTRIDF